MTKPRPLATLSTILLLLAIFSQTALGNICCPSGTYECTASIGWATVEYYCAKDLGYGVTCNVDKDAGTAVKTSTEIYTCVKDGGVCPADGSNCEEGSWRDNTEHYYVQCGTWNGDYCDNGADGFLKPYIRKCGGDYCYGTDCTGCGLFGFGCTCCENSIPYTSTFITSDLCGKEFPCADYIDTICDIGLESYVYLDNNREYIPYTLNAIATSSPPVDPINRDGYPNGLWTGVCAKIYSNEKHANANSDAVAFCADGHAQSDSAGKLPLAIFERDPTQITHYTGCPPVTGVGIEANIVELYYESNPSTPEDDYNKIEIRPYFTCVHPDRIRDYVKKDSIRNPDGSITQHHTEYTGVCARPSTPGATTGVCTEGVVSFDVPAPLYIQDSFATDLWEGCHQYGYYCTDLMRYWSSGHVKTPDGTFVPDGLCVYDSTGSLSCVREDIVNDSGTFRTCNADTVGMPCDSVFDPLTGWEEDSVCIYNSTSGLYECGSSGTEICDNGVDDDGDGMVDCFDVDCVGQKNANGDVCCYCDSDCPVYSGSDPSLANVKGKCDAPGGDYSNKAFPNPPPSQYQDESDSLPNCQATDNPDNNGANPVYNHTCYWKPCNYNSECDTGYCCTADSTGPDSGSSTGQCVQPGWVSADGKFICDPPGFRGGVSEEVLERARARLENAVWLGEVLGVGGGFMLSI